MPQPFATQLGANQNAPFHTNAGLHNRPALAVAFGEAMEQFAVCEGALGSLFLVLNASRPEEAFEELIGKINFSQRILLVQESANRLPNEDRALIWASIGRASTAASMRNRIAHCTWGYCNHLPNSVLQVSTRKSNQHMCERLKDAMRLPFNYEPAESGIMVYVQRDFNDIKNAAVEATASLELLANYIMNAEPVRSDIQAQMLSDPQTSARYNTRLAELTNCG